MKVSYFAAADIKALVEHSRELGWYTEADWQTFLRTGVVYGHRLQSGEIVSSAYFSNFDNVGGVMGAVIVNSRFQGKKLGKALIEKALSMSPDENFVLSLVATDRGKRMYEHAGFVEVGNTHKFVLDKEGDSSEEDQSGVRGVLESDWEKIFTLDQSAVNLNRKKLLSERSKQASEILIAENEREELCGFAMVSNHELRKVIGPVEANDFATALKLIKRLVAPSGKYRIDVPHWQSQLISALPILGFQLERTWPVMTFKGVALPASNDCYFALVSQALG